jgi:twinkle protein
MTTFADLGIVVPPGSGNQYTTCPQCSKDRKKKRVKCLSVNVDKGLFNCHHCGWHGSLAEGGRQAAELHWQRPLYRPVERIAAEDLPPEFLEWFSARGISERTLGRAKVKAATAYFPQVEDFAQAMVFPYFVPAEDRMEVVNRKYRTLDKNFRLEAGAQPVWYGLDRIAGVETVVVVEGEMDALAVIESGTWAVLSVPHGAPTPNSESYSSKFNFIAECEEHTRHVKQWILWTDNDAPGRALEAELARRLGVENCARVVSPTGKDANDLLIARGPEAVAQAIASAQAWPLEGVYEVGQYVDQIDALYTRGLERGCSTGWTALDEFWSVRPGEMTVVTGIPNSGKSNFVDALCVNVSRKTGYHVALCSPENQPIHDHMARMCEKWIEKPFSDGPRPRMSRDELADAEVEIHKRFAWILPDSLDLPEVLGKASALVRKHGTRILVLDPWNELDHAVGEREDQYLSAQLRTLKQWARKNDCHVIVVAHPKTLARSKDGSYPTPTPYDISGGAMWRNKVDNCLTVWRDFLREDGVIEVHVQKVRFRQVGKIGVAELKYDKATATYTSHDSRPSRPMPVPKRDPVDHWQDGTA